MHFKIAKIGQLAALYCSKNIQYLEDISAMLIKPKLFCTCISFQPGKLLRTCLLFDSCTLHTHTTLKAHFILHQPVLTHSLAIVFSIYTMSKKQSKRLTSASNEVNEKKSLKTSSDWCHSLQ